MFSCLLQLQLQVDELRSESSKERKMRERADEYNQELEQELETLKRKQIGRASSTTNLELTQEISRYVLIQNYRFRTPPRNILVYTGLILKIAI